MKIPKILVLFIFFLHSQVQADSSITITLKNHSPYDFSFSKYETAPKSSLAMDKLLLKPNDTVVITGTISADVDLRGNIYFNNDADRFSIEVRRLKKYGQPSFVMHGLQVKTRLDEKSLRFNTDGNPTHLAYTAATVYLEP